MVDSALRTKKSTDVNALPRRIYQIKPREPWELPNQTEEIPAPPRPPQAPGELNMLGLFLPPVLILIAYGGIMAMMSASGSSSSNSWFFLIMPLVSIVMPAANYITHKQQVKKYREAMQVREQNYRRELAKTRTRLDALAKQQREALDREYPLLPRLAQTGLGVSHQKRLWWRRMADRDFLSLRMGTGIGPASFKVNPPKSYDPDDPLVPLANGLAEEYQKVSDIPLLLDLPKVGSVGLEDRGEGAIYGFARRLILDIIVHHSPQDIQIVALADTPQAQDRWSWLKWAPHTRAIYQGESVRRLAVNPQAIDKTVEWLIDEFENRRKSEPGVRKRVAKTAIFVLLDDSGDIRRTEDIRQLTELGREADIYLMFVGGRNWPRECRAKINVTKDEFKYTETFAGEDGGKRLRGQVEPASQLDCERVARSLAGWEISGGGGGSALPETVRLSELVDHNEITLEGLKQNWTRSRDRDELLQFPFGLRSGRKGLEPVILNLLPRKSESDGFDAYHTILVGTTGSGKSEFMKTLALSAAWKYSPRLLNFFFMDFKGGATFNVLKDLPHVVGVVTNLGPQLVERGLDALEAEFKRRQKRFAELANIWAYNEKYPQTPVPHLMLLLDEFALGMRDFQRLPAMLDTLVRSGRSLGVYLLLANQEVNPAVDRLLNNVGWHILLKVTRQEEMHIIDRSLPKVELTGQGYLHSSKGDIYEFQAAYAGFPISDREESVEETFHIYQVGDDGKWQSIFTNTRRQSAAEQDQNRPVEQDRLISLMKELSREVEAAPPIYLEPLEKNIPLEAVLQESGIQRAFENGKWNRKAERARLVAPIGYTDSTEACIQEPLTVDFEDQDGHLWIIGGPASGKSMSLETTLLSLALTNMPEEAQFYILEFSAEGRLKAFQSLPHCGVVITPKDPPELMDRLFRFLDDEMNRRAEKKERGKKGQPRNADIFLTIHDFNELRSAYPDHIDRLTPLINGKAMGIHLIVSTNRRIELPNKLSIARKLVLRLTNRDDYSDAIGGRVVVPAVQAEGRGLWADGKPLECQIAQPIVSLDAGDSQMDSDEVCQTLTKKWRGDSAFQIRILPAEIPLNALMEQTASFKNGENDLLIPLGLSFETAQPITIDLLREIPRWLVLGPPRSGKSNFLACLANVVSIQQPDRWDIRYISTRRPAPSGLNKDMMQLATTSAEAVKTINELMETFEHTARLEKRVLLLFDDLGAAFEPGRETFSTALNNLALKTSSRDDVIIAGAGLPDELRPQQMMSKLVQNLKTSKNGIGLSRDTNDVELLGYTVPFQYRRMELPPGRGFWVSGNKAMLIHTPLATGRPGAQK